MEVGDRWGEGKEVGDADKKTYYWPPATRSESDTPSHDLVGNHVRLLSVTNDHKIVEI